MVRLKKYNVDDLIKTKQAYWKTPFKVEVIHMGYVVAVNKKTVNWVFLFIKTYTGEVFYGSSRFLKYGIKNRQDIKDFIEDVVRGEIVLEKDACVPFQLILDEGEYEVNEKREQVRYE